MNGSDKPFEDIVSMLETMLGEPDTPIANPVPLAAILTAAELSAPLGEAEPRPGVGSRIPDGQLAAYLDGGLDDGGRQQVEALLAGSPLHLHEAAATIAYLDDVASQRSSVPDNMLQAAIDGLTEHRMVAAPQADIIPLRGPPARQQHFGKAPLAESFRLLAAASDTGNQAIICHSQSGIWTLEVFVGQSEPDQVSGRGYLLMSVHPDHRATYEGRTARIFVNVGNEERVLAEETIRDGEVYAEILLTGLDLRTKDAVNVMFGPSPG